jgi:rhamnulose-1-phosphate aldolase
VVWAKHGVMTFSDQSVVRAADRIEYAETGAKYECLNLQFGEIGEGLSAENVRQIAKFHNLEQSVF